MAKDWATARATVPDKPGWPKGVKPVSLEGLDYLGVDDRGRLYWDGELLATDLRLSKWQTISVVVGLVAAIAAAIGTGIQAYVAWTMCAVCG